MTTQQPEALRLAELLELAPEDGIEPQTAEDAAAGLRRLHSENETLRVERERNLDSIRVNNEIINKQRDENETLQAGYAAARLEIASLQARIKTMAEEHADELAVAHLDGRMCGHSTEPAGAQQPAPPTAQAEGWTKLPGTLPKPGTPVLLDIGKEFPIRAMWAAKFTLPVRLEDYSGFGEHDERTDEWYCPEGWYEWNEHEEIHWRVTETPRAWAPLPPTTSAGSGNGE